MSVYLLINWLMQQLAYVDEYIQNTSMLSKRTLQQETMPFIGGRQKHNGILHKGFFRPPCIFRYGNEAD